ncbi:TlyA family RNA methyltransferase [Campylobacter corcagiensis]|uniref:TlyA family RNA methyltransferase n=1 Tax=Campylobacter corcagiensis TaxID=1448857 RepID=A0A7M1LFV8_9BACT|nr:TlyA family RNA methyltransferase [Campylobacter corcagiensis]QKF64886.1 16S/23S rRNA (cytidine-2'-O)-methyltransferase [Campylobacter corcagiensis]QOQ86954.1 TlyA family RNA methyltransferase [Campylobacter corcagiensis]
MRADLYTANALNISRNKASEMIKNGEILLDGEILSKPSLEIDSGNIVARSKIYVSRAALKLKSFLKEVPLDLAGKSAIDVGSSTGGFVQILLENGVKEVVAVDVGSSQLSEILRDKANVVIKENCDIRDFKSDKSFEILTCDISFISLNLVLDKISQLFSEFAILLFKPQFEVGKDTKRDKKGVVVDKKAIEKAAKRFELNAAKLGLLMIDKKASKVLGKDGNEEIFYLFKK